MSRAVTKLRKKHRGEQELECNLAVTLFVELLDPAIHWLNPAFEIRIQVRNRVGRKGKIIGLTRHKSHRTLARPVPCARQVRLKRPENRKIMASQVDVAG